MRRHLVFLTLLLAACESTQAAGDGTFCSVGADVAGLKVPDGFCIRKFAAVPTPRAIAFAPNGDVFVSSPSSGTAGGAPPGTSSIYVLRDNGTGTAPVRIYKQGTDLETVHGLAFLPSRLLYTVDNKVYALPYASGDQSATGATPTVFADLSDVKDSERWTHNLAVGPDGSVYVSRGQYDVTDCPPPDPLAGSVLRIGPGHAPKGDVVLKGLRNPLFMRCATWGCYAAELTGDFWDAYGAQEKLIELKDGGDFGFPCCVDVDKPRPDLSRAPDCSRSGIL